jgi:oxygen-independent coproporphyrinogen-3 oxidase
MAGAGLYIHIPFCRSKCGYCAFNSQAWQGSGPGHYLEAVRLEMRRVAEGWGAGQVFSTLFIGGGTPTIYSGKALASLLVDCLATFRWIDTPEITVETNPNTVTAEGLAACRSAGVNRLSIGVQAFDDHLLAAIGRSHSVAQAVQAVALARAAGFANINLDLIYGLPAQSLADWRQSLMTALELGPEHLALYELSVEPDTPFAERQARGELSLPDDDSLAGMEALAHELLPRYGYRRYEISNFARPGYQCRHNLNYWQNGTYLGLGAGAVSSFAGLRLKNLDDPEAYEARIRAGQPAFEEGEDLGLAPSFRETVIMGLRLIDGVELAPLFARYGLEPKSYYGATLDRLLERGLIAMDEKRLWLTAKALPVAHQVLSELV